MIRSLFTLALLLVAGGGGAAYFLSQGQPELATGISPVPSSSQAVMTFDQKVETVQAAVEEAKRSGTAQRVALSFTESELTSKAGLIVSTLTGGFVPTDPQIHLRSGEIVLTGGITISGFRLNLAVAAIPVVIDGKTSFAIKEIQTGGLPIPDGIKKEIDQQVAKILSPESLGLPLEVTKVEVQPGRLVLEGFAKP